MFNGIKPTKVPKSNQGLIQKEIVSLLQKNVIENVPQSQMYEGFYSTLFLVPKKNGEMRPVVNLKPLNRYLRKQHFKMETMTKVLNLVEIGDWAVTLDLKDAYHHIMIHKSHRKFLRFYFQGVAYQFRALCFGPSTAPRTYVKISSVVVAHLRKLGLRLSSYLDDWLILNKVQDLLLRDINTALNLLSQLGWIVNKEKSQLVPCQLVIYLGSQFDLQKGLVFPTQERINKLKLAVQKILKGNITARDYMVLLGLIASCLEMIPNARLYMRPIQLHLLKHWNPTSLPMSFSIKVTPQLVHHLNWWSLDQNIAKGKSLSKTSYPMILTTDASATWGWGGHLNNLNCQGQWSPQEKTLHINCLEMKAVFLCMKQFLTQLQNQNVMIRSDNTTVCQYINRQGGTKSVQLCQLTIELWELALKYKISMKAVHILGINNARADALSRYRIIPSEWSLNNSVVWKIFNLWGQPQIDLFATWENKKTPIFCAWQAHPKAFAMDALSIVWQNMFVYAFPPVQLIPRILTHFQQFQCTMILIAPLWPKQLWYPILLNLSVACPIKLPLQRDLLTQCKGRVSHPEPEALQLTAWLLSTEVSQQRVFQKSLEIYLPNPGERVHKGTTSQNLDNSVAGVINRRLIPIKHL